MPIFAILFLIGDIYVQSLNYLNHEYIWLAVLLLAVSISIFAFKPKKYTLALVGLSLGVAWTSITSYDAAHSRLCAADEGRNIKVEGYIESIPIKGVYGYSFMFDFSESVSNRLINKRVRLRWDTNKLLKVGDKYEFYIRLKRIHALRNPGSYNYEVWGLHDKISATGSVLKSKPHVFIEHTHQYPINQLRQSIHNLLADSLEQASPSKWIIALTIGERYFATQHDWEILRLTGTNHLMAIAGLHIGMISGCCYFIFAALWRRFRQLCFVLPTHLAAEMAALSSAWLYSALAGFALPTQRACIMLSAFVLTRISRKTVSAFSVWSLTMFIVILIDPLSTLTISFWLSFLTIALIIYGMRGRFKPAGLWWKWFRVQWVIGIGLLPMSFYFFQEASLVGFFANSIVIPLLSFFILPASLLGTLFLTFSTLLGQYTLKAAEYGLSLLWSILAVFADINHAALTYSISSWLIFICVTIACLAVISPISMPGRMLAIVFLIPIYFYKIPSPKYGEFWATLLDVGQGLSVVIETKSHNLVFDTGAKFGDKFDMGTSVVIPFLQSRRISNVDKLLLSHGDNDHAGARFTIKKHINTRQTLTGEPLKLHLPTSSACLAGQSWVWDGVLFEVLHPTETELNLGNDSSCVLRVSTGNKAILLTGDIEKFAEQRILARDAKIKASILVAPHHGSKTSGLDSFLSHIDPLYVLIPSGYRNRYRLPSPSVLRKYKERGYLVLNTAASGAIEFKINGQANSIKPTQFRYMNRHYWDVF